MMNKITRKTKHKIILKQKTRKGKLKLRLKNKIKLEI